MYEINLKNNKRFTCDGQTIILQGAKNNGIFLDHSCLCARCKSFVVKVAEGNTENVQEELVLSENENYVLSCNAKSTSDLNLTKDVIKLALRFPPITNFKFIS